MNTNVLERVVDQPGKCTWHQDAAGEYIRVGDLMLCRGMDGRPVLGVVSRCDGEYLTVREFTALIWTPGTRVSTVPVRHVPTMCLVVPGVMPCAVMPWTRTVMVPWTGY